MKILSKKISGGGVDKIIPGLFQVFQVFQSPDNHDKGENNEKPFLLTHGSQQLSGRMNRHYHEDAKPKF